MDQELNYFFCLSCHSEDLTSLYFLPCLHIFCCHCLANQVQHYTDNSSQKPSVEATVKDHILNYRRFSSVEKYFDDQKYLVHDANNKPTLIDIEDGYCEVLSTKYKSKKSNESVEGYEIPNKPLIYQNIVSPSRQPKEESPRVILEDRGSYEEVIKVQCGKQQIKIDSIEDEVFEEINVNKFLEKHQGTKCVNMPQKSSFHEKSQTHKHLKDRQESNEDDPYSLTTQFSIVSNMESPESNSRSSFKTKEVIKDFPDSNSDEIEHLRCPCCGNVFVLSHHGEIVNDFQLNSSRKNHKKLILDVNKRNEINKIVKLLDNKVKECSSKSCKSSRKDHFCATCGKALCDKCCSECHSGHYTVESCHLNGRYKDLLQSVINVGQEIFLKLDNEVRNLKSDVPEVMKVKNQVAKLLEERKKIMINEIEKICKIQMNLLEAHVVNEVKEMESVIDKINDYSSKVERCVNFSKALLAEDCERSNKSEISPMIFSYFSQFNNIKVPEFKKSGQIKFKCNDFEKDKLSTEFGAVAFNKADCNTNSITRVTSTTNNNNNSNSNGNYAELHGKGNLDDSGCKSETVSMAKPVANKSSGNIKPNDSKSTTKEKINRRLSKLFKSSSRTTNNNTALPDNYKDEKHQQGLVPSVSINFQLASDSNECKLTNFSLASNNSIIALDCENQSLKVLSLADDSFQVVYLKGSCSPLKVAALELDRELLFVVVEKNSSFIKQYNKEGTAIRSFGAKYLLKVSSVATNSLKQILVADTIHKKIFVHDYTGQLLFSFPRGLKHGNENNKFHPRDIYVNPANDDILIYDSERILGFDRFGTYLFQLPGNTDPCHDTSVQLFAIPGITAAGSNSNGPNSSNFKADPNLEPSGFLNPSKYSNFSGLTFDLNGYIYLSTHSWNKLYVLDRNGKHSNEIELEIKNLNSAILIAVLDCPIRCQHTLKKEIDKDSEEEGLSIERCIVLSSDSSIISIYKLPPLPLPDESQISAMVEPDLGAQMEEKVSQVAEEGEASPDASTNKSSYVDMKGLRQNNIKETHIEQTVPNDKAAARLDHTYSTIGFDDNMETTTADDVDTKTTNLNSKKSKLRLSERLKQKFRRKSKSDTTENPVDSAPAITRREMSESRTKVTNV